MFILRSVFNLECSKDLQITADLRVDSAKYTMAPAFTISIPVTSTMSQESKPYTVYHVTLQLPLRKYEVKKRYTDFVNLNSALISETSQSPPKPLPGKSWLRRTVDNASLTEERRAGLESYLKSIVQAEDSRWRSSSAWRSFLNLPGSDVKLTNGSTAGGVNGRRQSSSGVSDPNEWLEVHRILKGQIQNARQLLNQRNNATTAQQQHSLSADVKASLVRAATNIAQLEDGLKMITNTSKDDDAGWGGSKKLGDGELRRRRDLISVAKNEVAGLEGLLKSIATKSALASTAVHSGAVASPGDKEALWKGTPTAKPGGRVLGGPLKETERTRELDNSAVLQLQQQIMQEQDEDVLTLGKSVAKLKDMGIMINEELTVQNEMLGLLEGDADRVQGKIDMARRRIGKIS